MNQNWNLKTVYFTVGTKFCEKLSPANAEASIRKIVRYLKSVRKRKLLQENRTTPKDKKDKLDKLIQSVDSIGLLLQIKIDIFVRSFLFGGSVVGAKFFWGDLDLEGLGLEM